MAKRKTKDCPLYKHPNGQWMKKIGGKAHYFGTDLEEALKRYALAQLPQQDKDRLAAGLKPLRNDWAIPNSREFHALNLPVIRGV